MRRHADHKGGNGGNGGSDSMEQGSRSAYRGNGAAAAWLLSDGHHDCRFDAIVKMFFLTAGSHRILVFLSPSFDYRLLMP